MLEVMHKDIKEDNILVRGKGSCSRAQFILADFGFAEAVGQRFSLGLTSFSWRVTAELYRAPDLYFAPNSRLQIESNEIVFTPGKFVDASVMLYPIDMWAFGVVLCRCFLDVYPVVPMEQMAGPYYVWRSLASIFENKNRKLGLRSRAMPCFCGGFAPQFEVRRCLCVWLCTQQRFHPTFFVEITIFQFYPSWPSKDFVLRRAIALLPLRWG